MLLNSYGIENDSYVVDADGNYQISDKIKEQVANGEFPTVSAAIDTYNLVSSAFGLYNWGAFDITTGESNANIAREVWNVAQFDMALPASLSLTPEENTSIGTIFTDIQTLVNESTINFITGRTSLDEWDSYVDTVYSYGLDQVLSVYQDAYNRYLNR